MEGWQEIENERGVLQGEVLEQFLIGGVVDGEEVAGVLQLGLEQIHRPLPVHEHNIAGHFAVQIPVVETQLD